MHRLLLIVAFAVLPDGVAAQQLPAITWAVHDTTRPRPPVVDATGIPGDAIVLFDGTSLGRWQGTDGAPSRWKVEDGTMVATPGAGHIRTIEAFGDVQLHIEWMSPVSDKRGQNSGNSGVYLLSTYEIQVLNSYHNDTYPDGQAASVYGQYPPAVNASRAPGTWQAYDIIFHAPAFDSAAGLRAPATVTVLHNGVLVQDHVTLTGPTAHHARPPYSPHATALPLMLQDHGDPVRYRNIWIRRLQ